MKSLKSNAFIKTLSCIAFTFSSAICATALICVIIAGYVGCYSESTGEFLKTDYAKMYIENTSRYYAEEFSYTGNIERVHDAGLYLTIYDRGYPDTNITGRIYDENGNEIKISLENSSDIYDISSEENYYGEATANVKEQGPATNTGDFFTNGKAQNPGLSGDFEFTADNGKLYEIKYEIETPLPEGSSLFEQSQLYETVYPYRYAAAATTAVSGIISLVLLIFLVMAAGHRTSDKEIVLNLQDRIPLDLYYFIAFWVAVFGIMGVVSLVDGIYFYNELTMRSIMYVLTASVIIMAIVSGVMLGCILTTATRIKKGRFWRNTVCFWCIKLGLRFCRWIKNIVFGFVGSLSMTWGAVLFVMLVMFVNASAADNGFGFAFIFDVAVLLAVAKFAKMAKRLETAADEMAKGNINFKINTASMRWRFKKHGDNLNSINTGISLAVEKQMKSERMKTELITNVSHDIKTPLTSIINYVGLLKTEHTPEQEEEYIDVLSRQSNRLKKLIDDLLEASKASTGNINVEQKPLLASEIVYQSLAEYDERFKAASLNLVISIPDNEKQITADGRLLWRVLDNLFSNACKYAQGGTRVYVDLRQSDKETVISVKNISKDQLNINADELMERFVRGDSSRNTEGSGLGLNIARSLVELQGGKFNLDIDGDLFKAEIRLKN